VCGPDPSAGTGDGPEDGVLLPLGLDTDPSASLVVATDTDQPLLRFRYRPPRTTEGSVPAWLTELAVDFALDVSGGALVMGWNGSLDGTPVAMDGLPDYSGWTPHVTSHDPGLGAARTCLQGAAGKVAELLDSLATTRPRDRRAYLDESRRSLAAPLGCAHQHPLVSGSASTLEALLDDLALQFIFDDGDSKAYRKASEASCRAGRLGGCIRSLMEDP
jgi:hypothetical protein